MHITCETDALLQGVAAVERAVSNSEAQPILTGILIQAADNKVRLVATDRELGIEKTFPAEVQTHGECVIEGRLLSAMVRKLSGSESTLQLDTNGQAVIKSGAARFSIQTRKADEFPGIPTPGDLSYWRILQPEMRRLIRHTIFAVSREDSRPYLTGVLVEVEDTKIHMVSTDANRLASRNGRLSAAAETPAKVIVPAKSLSELARLIQGGPDEDLGVAIADNQIIFTMPDLKFVSRLIEGQFPDYRRVFPPSYQAKFTTDRGSLLEAVDRAILMSRKGPPAVRLSVQNGVLALSANEAEVGQLYEEIPITQEGQDIEMTYQARFLSDVLRVIEEQSVVVEMGTDLLPAVIYGSGDESYRYVVMPMRVG